LELDTKPSHATVPIKLVSGEKEWGWKIGSINRNWCGKIELSKKKIPNFVFVF